MGAPWEQHLSDMGELWGKLQAGSYEKKGKEERNNEQGTRNVEGRSKEKILNAQGTREKRG